MTWMFTRKAITSYQFQPIKPCLWLSILGAVHNESKLSHDSPQRSSNKSTSSPFVSRTDDQSSDYKINIVDDETWRAWAGFAPARKDSTARKDINSETRNSQNSGDLDLDDIDDLRICGKLFYKLDRDSKEYEEYNFNFHKRKSSKTKPTQQDNVSKIENKTKRNPRNDEQQKVNKIEESVIGKNQRVPTFNQLTGPYHEPFCLDVYISKASVRACIVHRATSKVVAVAHSISKDLKFELGSTRNFAACEAVGKVLAQRALADDIHNVVYTPRKGEKLEGKLENVVRSVINNGVLVKIKLKKKNKVLKHGLQSANYKPNYPSRW